MEKNINEIFLSIVLVGGLIFASCDNVNKTSKKPNPKPPSAFERQVALKKWEATPDGIMFAKWKASPTGQKVQADAYKLRKSVKANTTMEAIVTSLSLPPGSRLGFGVMIMINGVDYILSFGLELSNEFEQLRSLQVNDKIIIKSHYISYAPKYSYPIVAGDYAERNSKVIYKRVPRKGGC